jgi:uncharacterized protein YjaG (DUF416 family)
MAPSRFISIASFALVLMGCAHAQAVTPKLQEAAAFEGVWSVQWCDRSNPELDCGGFNVSLVQEGTRICGDFGGALVNLRQLDEGRVVGTMVGNTAILAVESHRNGSISLVRAELHGDMLKWKVVDEIRGATSSDIEVIADNEELRKQEQSSAGTSSTSRRSCDQIMDDSKD